MSGCPPDTVTPHFLHWVGATADRDTHTYTTQHKSIHNHTTDLNPCIEYTDTADNGVYVCVCDPGENAITKKLSQARRQKAEQKKAERNSAEIYFMV